ncbi:MAG TPA: ABC transporter ATP-binding protein [Planctomycetota bacterium]|nr:ABC transporter ATP-binding protein [Planctomycetota bacterium]
MTGPVATFRRAARWYGAVCGVVDVDLEVPGGVVGLLGPNGAGKSTLLKLLTGQLRPSAGEVRLLGVDPMRDAEVFRRVGFCSEDDALFEDLTPREFLRYLAALHGYRGVERSRRADRALERTGVAAAAGRRCAGLSKGTRQRVRIAAAVIHEPELLILDEPMTGLDPLARRGVLDLMDTWARAGRAVLFSSHILHEVEAAARHVVVLNKGMVLAEGDVAHLHACMGDYPFALELACDRPRALAERLVREAHVVSVTVRGDRVRVASDSARTLLADLPAIVLETGVAVSELDAPEENLETLFGRLVKA